MELLTKPHTRRACRTVASFLHSSTSVFQYGLGFVAAAAFIYGCAKGADSDEALHTCNLER